MKKIFLWVCIITSTLIGQIPTNGLVGYFPFAGNANDLTGNGNNGTINGATLTFDRFGNNNNAFSFNGTDNYISISNNGILDLKEFSYSIWFKTNSIENTYKSLFLKPLYDSVYWGNGVDFIGNEFIFYVNTLDVNTNNAYLQVGRWYHLVLTKSDHNNIARIYLNGNELVSTGPGNPDNRDTAKSKLLIGRYFYQNILRAFNGDIDDIRIYNRAIFPSEVNSLFNEKSNIPPPPTNLFATAGNGQVSLKWSKNTEADFLKYRIYIGTNSTTMSLKDSSFASISDTTKTITGLVNGQIYYFKVTSVDSLGLESPFSNEVQIAPSIVANGLVNYYPLDSNYYDGSGYKRNGTGSFQQAVSNRFDSSQKAISLGNLGNSINVPINTSHFTSSGTITLWINKRSSSGLPQVLFGSPDGNGYFSSLFYTNGSGQRLITFRANGIDNSDPITFNLSNGWLMLTFVWENNNKKIYVNDSIYLDASIVTPPGGVITNPVIFGAGINNLQLDGLQSSLDEIRIYNKALSQLEIDSLLHDSNFNQGGLHGPEIPKNLLAFTGNSQVTLKWSKNTEADFLKYRIYMGADSVTMSLKDSSTASISDTTITISGLTNGTIYYFRVSGIDSTRLESEKSYAVGGTPFAPINSNPIAANLRDTTIINTIRQRTVAITYNSTGSIDPDGSIDSVLWYINGRFKYSGTSFSYNYGPGTNDVMLIVKDNDGATDTSTAIVTKLYFREKLNGPIYSPISLYDDNTVYAVASSDAVYKYNIIGILDYYLEVGFGDTRSASVGSDGAIYIASENTNSLYAFSKTGTSVWPALALGAKASASPTVDNNGSRLYIGVANRNFQSVNKNTGSVMWNFFSDSPIRHSAVLTKDKRLVFSTIKGTVYGVNINENHTSPTWSLPVGDSINTSPAIDGKGEFYFGTTGGKVIKVRMKSGDTPSILWQSSFGSPMTSSPVIDARGNLYIGTQDGRLLSIKSLNGDLKWNVSTSGAVRSTASVSPKGLIYFGNDSKTFYAVDSLGAIQWLYRDSSAITAPSLFYNGVVYFGNNMGHFTAIYDADSLSPGGMRKFAKTTEDLSIPIWGTYQGDNQRTGVQIIDETVPVEIFSFSANNKNGFVELKWSTATEINNAGFEVLRKAEKDVDYKKITFVAGSGNSNVPVSYKYMDTISVSGVYKYLLKQVDRDGTEKYSNTIEIQISITPTEYSLSQNYPNPFNPSTTIRYGLPASSRVSIIVYNALGQQVADLVNTEQPAGWHEAVWTANVASGIYFYRIDAVNISDPQQRFTQFKKMLLLK